ncbi:MAG: hypothetical protein RBU45_08105 [Myxococcota bacterium]|nr:hypothetical protein [Myxococcota bacterium]
MIKVHRQVTLLEAKPEVLRELEARGLLAALPNVTLGERLRLLDDAGVDLLLERLLEGGFFPGVRRG